MELPPEHPERIGRRIRLMRLALGEENAAAFARSAQLTPQRLSNYEQGVGRPDLDAALKLVLRGGVTLDWLYRGETGGLSAQMLRMLGAAEAQLADRESPSPARRRAARS